MASPESVRSDDLALELQVNRVPSAWASWLTVDDGRTVEEYVMERSKLVLSRDESGPQALKQKQTRNANTARNSSDSNLIPLRRTVTCTYGTKHPRTVQSSIGVSNERGRNFSGCTENREQKPTFRRSSSAMCNSKPSSVQNSNYPSQKPRFLYPQQYPNQKSKSVHTQRWNRSKTPLAPKTEALLRAVGVYPNMDEIEHNKENIYKASSLVAGFRRFSFSNTSEESHEYDKELVKRKSKLTAFFRSRKSSG